MEHTHNINVLWWGKKVIEVDMTLLLLLKNCQNHCFFTSP